MEMETELEKGLDQLSDLLIKKQSQAYPIGEKTGGLHFVSWAAFPQEEPKRPNFGSLC